MEFEQTVKASRRRVIGDEWKENYKFDMEQNYFRGIQSVLYTEEYKNTKTSYYWSLAKKTIIVKKHYKKNEGKRKVKPGENSFSCLKKYTVLAIRLLQNLARRLSDSKGSYLSAKLLFNELFSPRKYCTYKFLPSIWAPFSRQHSSPSQYATANIFFCGFFPVSHPSCHSFLLYLMWHGFLSAEKNDQRQFE